MQGVIEEAYNSFLSSRDYPCVGAKAAVAAGSIRCLAASRMDDASHDEKILTFLYDFIDEYRNNNGRYHSAAVVFAHADMPDEETFERLLWQRLQSLLDIDSRYYAYDKRVNRDPNSPAFSFSIKEESMFIIGLHPKSSRKARQFQFPALAFNPHGQFEILRETGKYESFKHAVRQRDLNYSGSINPMLSDFGLVSETRQYSGREHGDNWKCPLIINHA